MISARFGKSWLLVFSFLALAACSTNAATGRTQFAGLMSPQQEERVGASEHAKVMQEFGTVEDPALASYVEEIGRRVTAGTERPDVQYRFFVLDTPMVNAFALPGGYVYVTRGLLALAGSEAELAAVIAHETGHITARHSAERYSRGVLTSLGAAVLSAAIDVPGASDMIGVGSDLYIKSYSRSQENEADTLGLRYMTRAGYDPAGMSGFLSALQADSDLQAQIEGRAGGGDSPVFNYFSTHPATAERIAKTARESAAYPGGGRRARDEYLRRIDGLVYGDSAAQGFVRGQGFFHPAMGFAFEAPPGFQIQNQPSQVVAIAPQSGAAILFDLASAQGFSDPFAYLTQGWMKGEALPEGAERITVGGMKAATAAFPGKVGGRPATIRLLAIAFSPARFARFQIAIPQGAPAGLVEGLKRASYSFRRLSAAEKAALKPYRLRLVTAKAGDSAASLARRQPFTNLQAERFRVLNGLKPGEEVKAGVVYKVVQQ